MCVFDTMGDINDDEGMDSVSVDFHIIVQSRYKFLSTVFVSPLCNVHNLFGASGSSFWL